MTDLSSLIKTSEFGLLNYGSIKSNCRFQLLVHDDVVNFPVRGYHIGMALWKLQVNGASTYRTITRGTENETVTGDFDVEFQH